MDACGEGSVISFIMGTICVWEETVESFNLGVLELYRKLKDIFTENDWGS